MTAPIGHNQPPITPLEAHSANADDLLALVSGSTAVEITTDEQEQAIADLLDQARDGKAAASEQCEVEYRPHKAAADKVKADYKPILAKFDAAANAIRAALTPYREARQRAKDEAARLAREEAAAKLEKAQAALRQSDDLEERFEAEAQLEQAAKLNAVANKIDRSATGLRTYWEAEITDRREALKHYITRQPEAFEALIQELADKDARGTRAPVPGVVFHERKKAA